MDRRATVAHVLAGPTCGAAIADGQPWVVIRAVREALDIKQGEIGRQLGYSQGQVSKLERGQGRCNDITVIAAFAQALEIPPGAVRLAGPPSNNGHQEEGETGVKRSEFIRCVLGVATAAGLPPILADDSPRRIGMSTVNDCRAALGRLYALDIRFGSGNLLTVGEHFVQRLEHLLACANYSMATGDELRRVSASAVENLGWSAFDAGQDALARRWWLDGIHCADLVGDAETRVIVLGSMALAASNGTNGQEVVSLIDAARRSVDRPSPRLESLLAGREALGHGLRRDKSAVRRAVAMSKSLLEQEPSDDEPTWTSFWGAADLACHEATALWSIGDRAAATMALRTAVANAPADAPRNAAIYRLNLAKELAATGDIEEAITLARPHVLDTHNESWRVRQRLNATVAAINGRGSQRGREFARWAQAVAS